MLKTILITFAACFIIERIIPGWKLPKIKTWPLRVIATNIFQITIVLLAGISWEKWISDLHIFSLSEKLDPISGGLLAYFIATFVFYWWHRMRHESDFLWKHFHQIHHSPQRLEVITSFYKHPLEMIANSIIGSILVYAILGLSPAAGVVYTLATALGEFVYHTNIKTPRFLGYFFQRPEMHRIHHKYNYHKNNYGDIVWWDMLFGTYENPKEFNDKCGFDEEKEEQLLAMLCFKDVHKKITRNKKQIIAIALLFFFAASPTAEACSVFAPQINHKQQVIAKNFDWFSGKGFLIKNSRGRHRQLLRDESFTWTAKYRSLSFSTLGPGLPISGMNEQGLVIETLVDLDSKTDKIQETSFLSLEWAQYVLDNFSNINEVADFAEKNSFTQIIVPVHYFICDKQSNCAVIEKNKSNSLEIISGSILKHKVLANRAWKMDSGRNLNLYKRLINHLNPNKAKSSKRFSRLVHETQKTKKSNQEVFNSLEKSKIPGLNMWQIIWNPQKLSVTWRTKFGSDKNIIRSESIASISNSCQKETYVTELGKIPNFRSYITSDLKDTEKRITSMILWRNGSFQQPLAKEISQYTMKGDCYDIQKIAQTK